MVIPARYDGHADWYDERFGALADEHGSAGLLARLLGPADPSDPVVVDIGCGTGLHFASMHARGYVVIGIDLSADPLRIAASQNPWVVRADAARLPMPNSSVPAVVMTFTHTDVDDFAAVVAEVARVLRPGGRLVYLGVHPAYVGAFADRRAEADERQVPFTAGYGDEGLQRDTTGRFPMRHRVGSRNLTLSTFLAAVLTQPTLRLSSFEELDTNMQPWRSAPSDGRVLPWNIAATATTTGT